MPVLVRFSILGPSMEIGLLRSPESPMSNRYDYLTLHGYRTD
jgi:hypothetical protein